MSRLNSHVTSADNSPPVTAARPKAEPRLRSRFAVPMLLNGVPGIIVAPAGRARYENFDGKIFRSPDDRSVAWDGIDPNLCLEKTGHRSDEIRSYRQNGFLDPAICPVLFLCPVAAAFRWPTVTTHQFFHSEIISWTGVLFCLAGLLLFLWSLISFRQSFRVGIDADHPDRLITDGVFAFSRNPIYVAFATILIGEFLIFPNWITLIYLGAATWLFHRQVLREEEYLAGHYGQAYAEYCRRVRRYV